MRALPAEERPRERLRARGAGALSATELIAILLSTGTRQESVLVVAERLLARFGSLQDLAAASVEELVRVPGVGEAKAVRLLAAAELGRRLLSGRPVGMAVTTAAQAAHIVMADMAGLDREQVRVILLDRKNRVIDVTLVSIGGLDTAPMHPREVFKDGIRRSSAGIILVHNHPSGDPTPSPEDVAVTRRCLRAGAIVGIDVLDHLIIGDNQYVSLRERGFWPQ